MVETPNSILRLISVLDVQRENWNLGAFLHGFKKLKFDL